MRSMLRVSALLPCFLLVNCATIVSKSNYPVTLNSNPAGAKVTVKNNAGEVVREGLTPFTTKLPSSYGYFKPASYVIEFQRKGRTPHTTTLTAGLNGWYFGNFAIGGLIGFLIVDPLTGAMWRLDTTPIEANLSPIATLHDGKAGELRIVDRGSLPAGLAKHLVALR